MPIPGSQRDSPSPLPSSTPNDVRFSNQSLSNQSNNQYNQNNQPMGYYHWRK